MVFTPSGINTEDKDRQPEKVLELIEVIPVGRTAV
jgi:hypothetical protein